MKRYQVRKLDTESRWFYVIDTTVPGAALLDPDAIVARTTSSRMAHQKADELNSTTPKED